MGRRQTLSTPRPPAFQYSLHDLAQPPLRETFHVFTDAQGVLRTDHWLKLGAWRALQRHYRLDRA